ncbi:DegV domain-containing protein CA [Clostridium pasteurianum DSM 525 = ATCC 6013]|uniref:DegV domain-containing protein CA n=1 Tax=Clostridium pasteurianum DSM 525 = ATCC 6013 TaxID=1262449 RepID=A0A0H3JAW2_CLOPA|nr:DegV family protein [Clostridium pasteurianum]AJA48890.1 DegV domain-containing protein CA [Clostridium pasteurianum DSM 525 = ATCC 6013]AJA52878.1 DegV domain-containing protein CA [Clostridium pasteurianum DSM 525 = ATCC 6013]AOZ76100.1 fatty acid-binding protein DegV [Clostridium pasteurianum DSM 525 = ATCC 6013]AOZ79896.1 fatty acid-binding protein DegV [Clostridium pasteurianum]ELP60186.1 degV protein [Clostridium pasteurianum DSM 525 = ATCC 6013]
MDKIKIITVSTADLNEDIIKKYDIEVLPLVVNIGENTYLDGIDIKTPKLLEYMKVSEEFPTTSQVNPQRCLECFEKYIHEGYKILFLNMSSKMSGTYQASCIARDMIDKKENIVIIDTLNVTSGLGVLVLKACRLREEGLNLYEIKKQIEETIPHVKSALIFNSLENLVKGGRLSKTAGTIGGILGIKLILEIKDGEISVMNKVRGTKKAVKTVLNYLDDLGVSHKDTAILLHIDSEEVRCSLRTNLQNNNTNFIECEVGCVVGTHSGADACGVFFIEKY